MVAAGVDGALPNETVSLSCRGPRSSSSSANGLKDEGKEDA